MEFQQFPEEVKERIKKSNGLRQALKRLEDGSPDTPRSWFYESIAPEELLSAVVSSLDAMQDLEIISEWDKSKSEKFAPQGGSAPLTQRLDGFEEYFKHLAAPEIISDPLWKKAKHSAVKRLGFNRSGTPFTVDAVIARGLEDDKYSTNSGWPLYVKRKSPEAIQEVKTSGFKAITEHFYFTLGTRATMGKTHEKARNIFMAPMATNVQGQRYVFPLQDYLRSKKMDFFAPWEGWATVQSWISSHWDDGLKIGADYTKMDQHFNKYHAYEVFDVVKNYFKPQYWEELRLTIDNVFVAPIITNLGVTLGEHAMPSGSEWTNFLETLWNFIFVEYLKLKYHLPISMSCGIGDDQLWILSEKYTDKQIEWLVSMIVREFERAGLPGNPEKQEVANDRVTFLQRFSCSEWNGLDGSMRAAGVYSLVRNLTSQVYPERYHNSPLWTWRMFALRVLMICENCVNHPLFTWWARFCYQCNPACQRFMQLSLSEQHAVEKDSRKIAGFIPTYNQEKMDQTITSFSTYKIWKELAA